MFWDKFTELCKSRGISPAQFAREVKISNGILTKWKSGSLPGTEALLKISQYFNVTIDYLLNDDNIDIVADKINYLEKIDPETLKKFSDRIRSLSRLDKEIEYGSFAPVINPTEFPEIKKQVYEYNYENESQEARRIRESIIDTLNKMNSENLKKTEEIIKIIAT